MTLNEGWIIFDASGSYEMKVHGKWKIGCRNPDVWIEHYPGGNAGYDTGTRERTVNLSDLYFKTKTDAETFIEYIDLLNATGMGWKLELQVHSDESKFKLDGGTGQQMMVLYKEYSDLEKVPFGDDQIYKIKSIKLEQAG